MRILKAVVTFAQYRYELNAVNPVCTISELKAWHKVPRRKRFIAMQQMPAWFQAVMQCEDRNNRDLHLILIFSGLRKNEAAQLQWSDINFTTSTILIRTTKNGDPLELPMSSYVKQILQQRKKHKKSDPIFVFRGRWEGQAISESYRGHLTIAEDSGVAFHFHDLRRTFATVADDLEIPVSIIKRLLNHRTNDVTNGYFCNSVERLRKPMQAINDEMLRRAGMDDLNQWCASMQPFEVAAPKAITPKVPNRIYRNAYVMITGAQQVLVEAKILTALKHHPCHKKELYQKLGGRQFQVNSREMERILNELIAKKFIYRFQDEWNQRLWRYALV